MFRSEGIPVFIKRILLLLTAIVLAALQNTDGLLPTFFGARLMPLIPFVVCVGIFEGETAGLLYGAAAGAFWDVCAGGPDGLHALYLAFVGCLAGLLVRFIMKNRLLTQYCFTTAASAVYAVLFWWVSVCIPIGDAGNKKLFGFYLPSAVVTSVFSFILYYFIRFISEKLREPDHSDGKIRRIKRGREQN